TIATRLSTAGKLGLLSLRGFHFLPQAATGVSVVAMEDGVGRPTCRSAFSTTAISCVLERWVQLDSSSAERAAPERRGCESEPWAIDHLTGEARFQRALRSCREFERRGRRTGRDVVNTEPLRQSGSTPGLQLWERVAICPGRGGSLWIHVCAEPEGRDLCQFS